MSINQIYFGVMVFVLDKLKLWKFLLYLKRLLKIYSLKSFILVRSVNIPNAVTLGKATIQRVSASMEKRQLPLYSPVAFDGFLLTSRYRMVTEVRVIDSYDVQPVFDTEEITNFLSNSTKTVLKSTNRCRFRRFPSPAGPHSLLLRS